MLNLLCYIIPQTFLALEVGLIKVYPGNQNSVFILTNKICKEICNVNSEWALDKLTHLQIALFHTCFRIKLQPICQYW